MSVIDTALALAFALGFPLLTWPVYRRRQPALRAGEWEVKRREYAETIAWLGSMGLATLILWFATGRELGEIGLRVEDSWRGPVAVLVAAAACALLVVQVRTVRRSASHREAARQALGEVAEYLPTSPREARWFRGVSLSAGVGEELFYRGFLLWYLSFLLPLVWAVVASSILFGFAHVMHGWQSTLRATGMGFLLAALYLFGGALWAPMLLHTAVDWSSGEMALAVLGDRSDSAAD